MSGNTLQRCWPGGDRESFSGMDLRSEDVDGRNWVFELREIDFF